MTNETQAETVAAPASAPTQTAPTAASSTAAVTAPKVAAPAASAELEITLNQFALETSATDKRVGLLHGFVFEQTVARNFKDTQTNYKALYAEFANKPISHAKPPVSHPKAGAVKPGLIKSVSTKLV
jgi:hypothetical protein